MSPRKRANKSLKALGKKSELCMTILRLSLRSTHCRQGRQWRWTRDGAVAVALLRLLARRLIVRRAAGNVRRFAGGAVCGRRCAL